MVSEERRTKRCAYTGIGNCGNQIKLLSEFFITSTGRVQGYCLDCQIEYNKHHILAMDSYKTLYDRQNGVCAICKLPPEEVGSGKRPLSIDHDHRTGLARGLLCGRCNSGLGFFRDSTELLKNAIDYLEVSQLHLPTYGTAALRLGEPPYST